MNEQHEALRLADWFSVDADLIQRHSLDPDSLEELETYLKAAAELKRLYEVNQELVTTGQAVVDRWDSPLWKDLPHTANYIYRLRDAILKAKGESNE